MRVLLIVDRLFAQHERAMLQRTAIGLLDEGIETRLIVPDLGVFETTKVGVLVPQINYKDRGLTFTLKIRAMDIIRKLSSERSGNRESEPWDIVHAFGGQSWALANELAKAYDASLVLEIWRAGLIQRAAQMVRNSPSSSLLTAPDKSIERAAVDAGVRFPIQVTPWGVPAPSSPRKILKENKGVSIVLQSSGREKNECCAAFDGVLSAIRGREDAHLFVNLHAAKRAGLWARAKQANALSQLTLIDKIEEQRVLALNADFLIYPDTIHEHRSLLFEAMGNAMCVVATTDDQSSCIIKDSTAAIVRKPSPDQWASTLTELMDNPSKARELGTSAWNHIREHRKVSKHIGATIDAYSQLMPQPV